VAAWPPPIELDSSAGPRQGGQKTTLTLRPVLSKQNDAVKPKKIEVIPTGNEEFPVIIFAPVAILDGKSFIDVGS
jgi:hypothetical protein